MHARVALRPLFEDGSNPGFAVAQTFGEELRRQRGFPAPEGRLRAHYHLREYLRPSSLSCSGIPMESRRGRSGFAVCAVIPTVREKACSPIAGNTDRV
jgi:hypothetical protein